MPNVWNILDKYMTRYDLVPDYRGTNLYPSEASIISKNKHGEDVVHGACLRKAFFRYKFGQESNLHPGEKFVTIHVGEVQTPVTIDLSDKSARMEWVFEEGRRIENTLIQVSKEAGIYYSGHKKFLHKIEEGFYLSGELDAILKIDGELVGAEFKTTSGYMSEKDIYGTPSNRNVGYKGSPRDSHLLQTALYAWKYKDQIKSFKIIYFQRGSCLRTEFDVTVEEDPLNQDFKILVDRKDSGFTINQVLARYQELINYIKANNLPKRDYDLVYDDNKMNLLLSRDELLKTKSEAWQKYWDRVVNGGRQLKRPEHGDVECSWCSYQSFCYKSDGSPIEY